MAIQESGEMYLETILTLSEENSFVRAIDVSESMGFSKPSVSRALGLLKADELLEVKENGQLILTEKGFEIAKKIKERHDLLTAMFMGLGVSKETAIEDACKIEHVISDETFDAIKKHVK